MNTTTTIPDYDRRFGLLCDAIREAGLDPVHVLADGGANARAAAASLRGSNPRLATALVEWGTGLAVARLDHAEAQRHYAAGLDALSPAE